MFKGLKFKGISSNEFDLAMRSDNRQLLPQARDEYEYAIDKDGSILFDDALADRFIEVSFTILTNTGADLRERAREIASWLNSRQREELVFDDEPDKFYKAKVANQIDLQQVASLGEFSVTFRCEPYAYKKQDSDTFDITTSPETVEIENTGTVKTPAVFVVRNNGSNTVNEFTLTMEEVIE